VDSRVQAVRSLKYMLLMKILLNEAADVPSIVTGKLALTYAGRDLEAMQAVASASLARSLADFEKALKDYAFVSLGDLSFCLLTLFPLCQKELQADDIIQNHVQSVYDSLLQLNLIRIVEPFSRVEVCRNSFLTTLPNSHFILFPRSPTWLKLFVYHK